MLIIGLMIKKNDKTHPQITKIVCKCYVKHIHEQFLLGSICFLDLTTEFSERSLVNELSYRLLCFLLKLSIILSKVSLVTNSQQCKCLSKLLPHIHEHPFYCCFLRLRNAFCWDRQTFGPLSLCFSSSLATLKISG